MSRARRHSATPAAGASAPGRAGARERPEQASPGRRSEAETMRFSIPSDLERGREVQELILRACRESGFDEDAFFAVKLALDEAVTNAIKHGNGGDAAKHVEVVARINPQFAHIEIRDEGPGFDRTKVPDPTCDENLDKCSGRGLLLIEAYMSSVSWSEDGRTIRMTKHNTAEPPRVRCDEC